jgi:hypothetical protein
VTIWAPVMLNGELDMLNMRLAELPGVHHVVVEAPVTHRGYPRPLHFRDSQARYAGCQDRITHVVADLPQTGSAWVREHAQRDAAWPAIDAMAADDDLVIIGDADEIPSAAALAWAGNTATSLMMRTFLYAVDWEVPASYLLPPAAVAARAGWIRTQGGSLAAIRDRRDQYAVLEGGGWHFSWLGGPLAQADKLDRATCHTELLASPEAALIRSGARYRAGEDGGGIPVVPVEVDRTWPNWIRRRRCPDSWFRPRETRGL